MDVQDFKYRCTYYRAPKMDVVSPRNCRVGMHAHLWFKLYRITLIGKQNKNYDFSFCASRLHPQTPIAAPAVMGRWMRRLRRAGWRKWWGRGATRRNCMMSCGSTNQGRWDCTKLQREASLSGKECCSSSCFPVGVVMLVTRHIVVQLLLLFSPISSAACLFPKLLFVLCLS